MNALESLIQATGLDRHVLRQDLYCAVNRFEITRNDFEMTDLTRDQLLMYLMIARSVKGDPLWAQIEHHLGEVLPA